MNQTLIIGLLDLVKSLDSNLNIIQSNIYNIASLAYIDSLNQGANNSNIIIKNNNNNIFIINNFDDLLIFNSNINNKKSIFEENININTINTNSYANKNYSINTSINKSNKIEIKDLIKPNTYKEAINSPNKDNQVKSILLELDTLNNNNTWDLVPRPNNTKVLKSRQVYKIKDLILINPIFKSKICS